jgi:hypothetical protein
VINLAKPEFVFTYNNFISQLVYGMDAVYFINPNKLKKTNDMYHFFNTIRIIFLGTGSGVVSVLDGWYKERNGVEAVCEQWFSLGLCVYLSAMSHLKDGD